MRHKYFGTCSRDQRGIVFMRKHELEAPLSAVRTNDERMRSDTRKMMVLDEATGNNAWITSPRISQSKSKSTLA